MVNTRQSVDRVSETIWRLETDDKTQAHVLVVTQDQSSLYECTHTTTSRVPRPSVKNSDRDNVLREVQQV